MAVAAVAAVAGETRELGSSTAPATVALPLAPVTPVTPVVRATRVLELPHPPILGMGVLVGALPQATELPVMQELLVLPDRVAWVARVALGRHLLR